MTEPAAAPRDAKVDKASERSNEASPERGPRTSWSLPRVLLILLGVLCGLVLLNGIQGIKDFAAPTFLAVNLALVVAPLQSWLVRHRVPKFVAASIAGLLVMAFLAVFVYALGWSITALITELPHYRNEFNGLYDSVISFLAQFGISEAQLNKQVRGVDPSQIVSVLSGILSNLQGVMSVLVIVVTALFFVMMDSAGFGDRLLLASESHPRIADALRAFGDGVRRYWVVTTVFGVIVAILDVIALGIIGVPLALVWGVLSFLTNYIPNVGFVIGLIPPALMALLAEGPREAIWVVVVYSVLNFVVQSIIQPKFTGDAVGVTPTVTFVSLLVWAWALGPLGALLALPATLLLKAILIDADPRARWVNALIASDPSTAKADDAYESFTGTASGDHIWLSRAELMALLMRRDRSDDDDEDKHQRREEKIIEKVVAEELPKIVQAKEHAAQPKDPERSPRAERSRDADPTDEQSGE